MTINLSADQLQPYISLTYQRRTCLSGGTTLRSNVFAIDTSGRTLEELIDSARSQVNPPAPSIVRLPSYDDDHAVVVQTPLWVWTTDPVTETAADGASLRVAVTSHLEHIDFTLSGSDYTEQWRCDPTQVQVSGQGLTGEQYLRPDHYNACHAYVRHSSTGEPNDTFTLTATATWAFTYTINGSTPIDIPGTIPRTNTFPVDVIEILVVETEPNNP